MLLQKYLSKQHFSFTAEYIYNLEKSKHCQLWHISRLYDLAGTLEVLLSDILQTKSYCRRGQWSPSTRWNLECEIGKTGIWVSQSHRGKWWKKSSQKSEQYSVLVNGLVDGKHRSKSQMRKMGHRESKDLLKVAQLAIGYLKKQL